MPQLEPVVEFATEWLTYAEVDLRIARMCAADVTMPLWPIGFHCQQAVEKCLKAALVLQGVTPEKTHRLGDLAKELQAVGVALPIAVAELLLLTPFGIDEKYPRVKPGKVAAGDAAVLIGMAQASLDWLRVRVEGAGGDGGG